MFNLKMETKINDSKRRSGNGGTRCLEAVRGASTSDEEIHECVAVLKKGFVKNNRWTPKRATCRGSVRRDFFRVILEIDHEMSQTTCRIEPITL